LFFENKLKNGLSHVWKRREKVEKSGKGWKRWESTVTVLENAGFHVLQARTYSLTAGYPTYKGLVAKVIIKPHKMMTKFIYVATPILQLGVTENGRE